MGKKEKIDFTGVSQEIFKRGPKVPEGNHLLKVNKAEKRWKDDDRSNTPYFQWELQVVSKTAKGGTLRFITSLKPEALFNLRNLIYAATGKNVAGKSLNFAPDDIYGKIVMGTVEIEEYEATKDGRTEIRQRSVLVDVAPKEEYTEGDAETESDDDDEDEEVEVESEDEEEEESEDLEEVDLDEL